MYKQIEQRVDYIYKSKTQWVKITKSTPFKITIYPFMYTLIRPKSICLPTELRPTPERASFPFSKLSWCIRTRAVRDPWRHQRCAPRP